MSRLSSKSVKVVLAGLLGGVLVPALLLYGGESWGAEAKKGNLMQQQGDNKTPTVITSRSMNADNKAKTIVFTENVVVVKGETTIYADVMTVFYDANDDIDRIECKGSVKIIKGPKTAVSKEAVYYDKEDKVILTGEPKVWEGNNLVTGTKMTMFLSEDRSIVEGSRVTLYPKNKEQK